MLRTQKQTRNYNGFAIPLEPDTERGMAFLIAEDEEGNYEPVSIASTINEAKELAEGEALLHRSFLSTRNTSLIRPAPPVAAGSPLSYALLTNQPPVIP